MAIDTTYDRDCGLWIHKVRGAFDADEVLGAQEKVYSAPANQPGDRVLWDLLEADAGALDRDNIRWMVYRARRFWDLMKGGKSAIVTPGDQEFGLARMYQLIADEMPRRLGVFRSCEKALEWLLQEDRSGGNGGQQREHRVEQRVEQQAVQQEKQQEE
jgi:hypothetical protein